MRQPLNKMYNQTKSPGHNLVTAHERNKVENTYKTICFPRVTMIKDTARARLFLPGQLVKVLEKYFYTVAPEFWSSEQQNDLIIVPYLARLDYYHLYHSP
jgi:hypothetical protein